MWNDDKGYSFYLLYQDWYEEGPCNDNKKYLEVMVDNWLLMLLINQYVLYLTLSCADIL